MNRIASIAFAAALAFTAATTATAPVFASDAHVTLDQKTEQTIRERLTAQGYEVRKVKTEDGMYEAYVMKDGKRAEVILNKDLEVVRVKSDD
jgi:hypothetical protein